MKRAYQGLIAFFESFEEREKGSAPSGIDQTDERNCSIKGGHSYNDSDGKLLLWDAPVAQVSHQEAGCGHQ